MGLPLKPDVSGHQGNASAVTKAVQGVFGVATTFNEVFFVGATFNEVFLFGVATTLNEVAV